MRSEMVPPSRLARARAYRARGSGMRACTGTMSGAWAIRDSYHAPRERARLDLRNCAVYSRLMDNRTALLARLTARRAAVDAAIAAIERTVSLPWDLTPAQVDAVDALVDEGLRLDAMTARLRRAGFAAALADRESPLRRAMEAA